jgi:hypothetical protein
LIQAYTKGKPADHGQQTPSASPADQGMARERHASVASRAKLIQFSARSPSSEWFTITLHIAGDVALGAFLLITSSLAEKEGEIKDKVLSVKENETKRTVLLFC